MTINFFDYFINKFILPKWIKIWLLISGIICTIDVTFTMLRPLSLRGNSFENFFYLWNIYADVDVRYKTSNDLVTCTTGRVMLFEIILNFVALYMDSRRSKHTLITAFFTTVLVFWKTIIYMSLYILPPSADSSTKKIFFCFWVMNGIWVLIPSIAIFKLWSMIVKLQ